MCVGFLYTLICMRGGGGGDWYSLNIRGFTFDCATLQYNLVNLNSFVSPLSVTYSV